MYAKRQQSLVDWGKQKWRTKSGKKSSAFFTTTSYSQFANPSKFGKNTI